MNHSFRLQLATACAAGALLMPLAASALTVDELQAQIKSLMTQLQSLREQLRTQVASSSPVNTGDDHADRPCLALGRTLGRGMQGDDVSELQRHLMRQGDLASTSATGFFGMATEMAVRKMQMRLGLASTTGVVGPWTRDQMKQDCGLHLGEMKTASSSDHWGDMPRPMQMMGSSSPMRGGDNRGPDGGAGTVSSISADSISYTDGNGSHTVAILPTTMIRIWDDAAKAMRSGSVADIIVGDKVMVHAMKQADGSAGAVLIQKGFPMMPQMGGFMSGGDHGGPGRN